MTAKIIIKIAFFILVFVAIGVFNAYCINGPVLQQNTESSMKQFSGQVPTSDLQFSGYWVSTSTIYVLEVVLVSLVAALLFLENILNVIFHKKED